MKRLRVAARNSKLTDQSSGQDWPLSEYTGAGGLMCSGSSRLISTMLTSSRAPPPKSPSARSISSNNRSG
ncbi:hypothetical protein D3C71_1769020 [compost metagenome]